MQMRTRDRGCRCSDSAPERWPTEVLRPDTMYPLSSLHHLGPRYWQSAGFPTAEEQSGESLHGQLHEYLGKCDDIVDGREHGPDFLDFTSHPCPFLLRPCHYPLTHAEIRRCIDWPLWVPPPRHCVDVSCNACIPRMSPGNCCYGLGFFFEMLPPSTDDV